MAQNNFAHNDNGPVLVCGASAISFGHRDGEPTFFDRIANAFKRSTNDADLHVENAGARSTAVAHGIAG